MIQYTVMAQVKTDVDVYEADGKTEILWFEQDPQKKPKSP